MAEIVVVTPDRDGEVVTPAAASGLGDYFQNNGKTILFVQNDDVAGKQVTIASQVVAASAAPGQAPADDVKSVAAGAIQAFGPYPPRAYNDGDERVQIAYDAVTSVTVWAVTVG